MDSTLSQLSSAEKNEVELAIMKGVAYRTSVLLYILSVTITLYGIASFPLFKSVIPDLKLFDNIWPRIIYTAIPSLLLGYWYSHYEIQTKTKVYLTPILLPGLLLTASFVHAFPHFWNTDPSYYIHFHGTNIIATLASLAVTAGSLRLMLFQSAGFFLIFFLPIIVLLIKAKQFTLLSIVLQDYLLALSIFMPGLYLLYRTRYSIALAAMNIKKQADTVANKAGLTQASRTSFDNKIRGSKQDELNMIAPNMINQWNEITQIAMQIADTKEAVSRAEERHMISKQVAHDIRSPLSALNMVLKSLNAIEEDKRFLIRNAVNRINDIANQLLSKNTLLSIQTEQNSQTANILLASLLDELISEKRLQFRELQNVVIESDLSQGYGIFASINPIELKRAISNLINNAVEALPNKNGRVIVALRHSCQTATIVIQDNGIGIPENILHKLGQPGTTHGKSNTENNSGSGLGVYHAMESVAKMNGKIQFLSREGLGTSVNINLTRINPPEWFMEKIILTPNTILITLDDDKSIHQIWQSRLSELQNSKSESPDGIKNIINAHRAFTSSAELKKWLHTNNVKINIDIQSERASEDQNAHQEKNLFLIDYELMSQNINGLDLIEQLNITHDSILVTSHYDDSHVRTRCKKLGIKIIPKSMVSMVPINFEC